jgi:hypothetical protein
LRVAGAYDRRHRRANLFRDLVSKGINVPKTIDPKKLVYLMYTWGWRGPVALVLVIFIIWLLSVWIG